MPDRPLSRQEIRNVRALLRDAQVWKRTALAILAVVCIVGAVVTVTLLSYIGDVNENADKIAKIERKDRNALRRATYYICFRQQLERAEIHAAYSNPITVPAGSDPVVAVLLSAAEVERKRSLARVRDNLPILNCKPNLKGRPAVPKHAAGQRSFVARYLAGLLDPNPGHDGAEAQRRQEQIERRANPPGHGQGGQRQGSITKPRSGGGGGGTSPTPRPRTSPTQPTPNPQPSPQPSPQPNPQPNPTPVPTPTTPNVPPTPNPGGLLPDVIGDVCSNLPLPVVCP